MAMRVLSGLIVPTANSRHSGTATIDFQPHTVSGDVVQPPNHHKEGVGPNRPFTSEPCKILALREIRFRDTDTASFGGSSSHTELWDINDNFLPNNTEETRKTGLVVSWEARRDAEVHEIAYMIVGEVAD